MRGANSGTKAVIRVAFPDSTRRDGGRARRGRASGRALAERSQRVLGWRHENRTAPESAAEAPLAAPGNGRAPRERRTPLSRALFELERQSAARADAQGGALAAREVEALEARARGGDEPD